MNFRQLFNSEILSGVVSSSVCHHKEEFPPFGINIHLCISSLCTTDLTPEMRTHTHMHTTHTRAHTNTNTHTPPGVSASY